MRNEIVITDIHMSPDKLDPGFLSKLRTLSRSGYLLVSNGPVKVDAGYYFKPQIDVALRLELDNPQGIFDFPGATAESIQETLIDSSLVYVIHDNKQWKVGFVAIC